MTLYFFIAFFHWMSGHSMHDIHISVCEIEFDEESRALEISQRIFLDDLEEILVLNTGDNSIDVLEPNDKPRLDSLIGAYLMTHVEISVNGKAQTLNYLGSQAKGDVMLVFIEVPKVKKMESIRVKNSVLMDLFPDQINLVHIKKDGETRSLKMEIEAPVGELTYQ